MTHDADLFGPTIAFSPATRIAENIVADPPISDGSDDGCDDVRANGAPEHAESPQSYRSQFLDARLDAQESERLRLGRELHDSTGQLLLALRLSLARLRNTKGSEESEEILSDIDDTVRQIDQEIRTFSFLNYPAELGSRGLSGALEALTRGFAKRTGIRIDFQGSCLRPCSEHLAIALLRIGQEALMNVHRHARATWARMTLVERGNFLELSILDDGRGMPRADHDAVQGVGLQGMRHRVERLGGHFAIRRLKHGTKLVATVPRMGPRRVRTKGGKQPGHGLASAPR